MNVRYHISEKLRQIEELIENENAHFEDVEGAAIHYAHQGAKISQQRWQEITELGIKTGYKVHALNLLKDALNRHFILSNSDKDRDFFIEKIRTEVLPVLEQKENYEGCAIVVQFMNEF
jgi:hypothetical protein